MTAGPKPLTGDDLRTTRIQATADLEFTDMAVSEEEARRKVLEWCQTHGPYTHLLLRCGPQIVTTTGRPTTIVILKSQPVTPCRGPSADIVAVTTELWRGRVSADGIPYMSFCFVPLFAATERDEDRGYLVRMQKFGATKLIPKLSAENDGPRRN